MSKKLIICEKPSFAKKFANAFGVNNWKDGYIEGKNMVVSWCFGHLLSLKEPGDYNSKYKSWDFEDLPIIPKKFETKVSEPKNSKRKKGIKKQYNVLKKLIHRKDVKEIINAGDAGREGELIVRFVLEHAKNTKPVKRLWVSEETKKGIKKAYDNLKPAKEYDKLYESALTRAILDWLIGMNYTRAYTVLNEGGDLLSIGRVQTPIVEMINNRDKEIEDFNPVPYYQIKNIFQSQNEAGGKYKGKYISDNNNTRVFDKKKAEKIKKDCKNNTGEVKKVETKLKKKNPPKLFNQTNLQRQMNKGLGFSATKTLNICQTLYEKYEVLSYPRTDSKHLPKSHKKIIPKILKRLNFGKFKKYIDKLDLNNLNFSKRFINDKKVSDHYALVPTDKSDIKEVYNHSLSKDEKKVFEQVVLRLLVQLYDKYKYKSTSVITEVDGKSQKHQFESKGQIIVDKGWREIYPTKNGNKKLPDLNEGEIKDIKKSELIEKETKPPSSFTEGKLLKQLQRYKIGTDATRANIIEKVIRRNYVKKKGKKLKVTKKGRKLINMVDSKKLKSPELTGELQKDLEKIKKGKQSKEKVLKEVKDNLKKDLNNLKDKKINIGKKKSKNSKKEICDCPQCDDGKIIEFKWGYGCSNYSSGDKCNFSVGKIAKKKLTNNQIERLCDKKETKYLRGFKSKKGNKFSAKVLLVDKNKDKKNKDKNYKTKLEYKDKKESKESDSKCPSCSNKLMDRGKFYGCSNYPKCKFSISKKICDVKIDKEILDNLHENKESKVLTFEGSKGEFKAKILVNGEDTDLDYQN